MAGHPGKPIPSPALTEHIGTRFRGTAVTQPHIAAQSATGKSGVAAVGVFQEFQRVRTAYQRETQTADTKLHNRLPRRLMAADQREKLDTNVRQPGTKEL
jgi:hypothetical protein